MREREGMILHMVNIIPDGSTSEKKARRPYVATIFRNLGTPPCETGLLALCLISIAKTDRKQINYTLASIENLKLFYSWHGEVCVGSLEQHSGCCLGFKWFLCYVASKEFITMP